MANSKISALPSAATVVGTEVLPIVQSSATVKVAIADLNPGLSTISATKGGTGQTSYAVGDLLYANTTTTLAKLADVATGNALISGGVGVAPSYGKIGLTTHVSGTLPVANGGTNASSASITAFNNITGYSASGATGTTTTNLVFSTSPTLVTPTLGAALATSIKFGSGSVLSSYEEGTFSPTLLTDGVNFTSVTYFANFNGGKYTKIGRVVVVQITLGTSAITVGAATGNLLIGNLPFTCASHTAGTQDGFGNCALSQVQSFAVNQPNAGRVNAGTTQINLYYRLTSNGTATTLPVSDAATGASSNIVVLTATYMTA